MVVEKNVFLKKPGNDCGTYKIILNSARSNHLAHEWNVNEMPISRRINLV
jgi:hypothetical protein